MKSSTINFGRISNPSDKRVANDITICLTEECNLRCKYCYMTSKNSYKKLSLETAMKAVDYVLNARDIYTNDSVVWGFIGGEPLLEIDLLDKICDYIKLRMYELNHPWFDDYMFSFATNGLLYHTEKVQHFIKKNHRHLSIGISIDGNKLKHDAQRVYADGRGSYDDVAQNVPLWLKQFKNAPTKATFASGDLVHLKNSVVHLWDMGVKKVMANIVFEDVWQEGDPEIFEEQLKSLADYIIEKDIWRDNDYTLRFFDPSIGFPLTEEMKDTNTCGSGKMVAIDCDGNLFPCIRFLDFSLNNHPSLCVGNVYTGVQKDKLKPFKLLTRRSSDPGKCGDCEVASGCMSCAGLNYDASNEGTIFKRATYNCDMHKANVRAAEYFWARVGEKLKDGEEKNPRETEKMRHQPYNRRFLMIYTDDKVVPYCGYSASKADGDSKKMSTQDIDRALNFAKANYLQPMFIRDGYICRDYNEPEKTAVVQNVLGGAEDVNCAIVSLLVSKEDFKDLSARVQAIFAKGAKRVNIMVRNMQDLTDECLGIYKRELELVADFIEQESTGLQINVLSDVLVDKKIFYGCNAGVTTYTLAPNGKLYLCPGFYFENESRYAIGDLETGFTFKYQESLVKANAPDCAVCKNRQCKRCVYINKKLTNEYTISPEVQCKLSDIEKEIAMSLAEKIKKSEACVNA